MTRNPIDMSEPREINNPQKMSTSSKNEICYVILGKRKSPFSRGALVTHGRLVKKTAGDFSSVEFDWQWALKREEQKGDILGFWHSHPDGALKPSKRDIKTMEAWVSCFGKSLICVIQNYRAKAAYLVVPPVRVEKTGKEICSWAQRPFRYKIFRRFGVY